MDNEIVARFGADTGGFDRALRGMNQGLNQAGTEGALHFGRVAKSGKEFKNLLHEISGESAGLGAALKFAFSPLAGILATAAAGFAAVKEHIGAINANSDRLEKGTADPVFKMADALLEAKKRLMEFDEVSERWHKTHGTQTPIQKMTENLKEQLSLLDKQVGLAEKLSQKDKEALEIQKLRVTRGLQARQMMGLSRQYGIDSAAATAAEKSDRALRASTSPESAEAALKGNQDQLSKVNETIEQMKKAGPSLLETYGPVHMFGGLAEQRQQKMDDLLAQKLVLEKSIRQNKASMINQQAARRKSANALSDARSTAAESYAAFQSSSMALEETDQTLRLIPGGFGASPVAGPMANLASATAAWQANYNSWSKAHGMGDMFATASAKAQQDPTSKNIEDLNTMFKRIITDAGMKVSMTVEDQ